MKLIRINFREKPAERLELREVYDKGTLVNLMIMPCGKSVSVKVSSEDSWLTVSKEAFTMEKGGQAVMIGVTVAPGPRDEEARCESALHFHCAADGGAEEDVRFEIVAHYMKYSSSDASPRYHSSLKGWEEGGQEPPGQNGFHCSDCGAPIPDKRPFCALCRKKRSQESREEQQVSTIDAAAERIAEKVPLFNILAIISVALICIVVFISLSAPAKVQDVNGPSIAALQGEGALSITTDPPGAEVVFLSNEIEPSKTPLSLPSVKAGVYRLKLEKEGCAGTGTVCTVVVKPGCKNSYSFSLTRLGKIYAQSIPPGLDITLDGKAQSVKTPALLTALPAGEHELLLSGAIKGNEFRRSYTVDVKWNETSQIFALNDTRLSGLHVSSQEGTRIYVDGALRGTVPCEPCLFKPGGHAVSLVRKGYSSWRSGMSFQAGEVAELSVELPALAQLVLDGEPGAALYLNDRYKGALPQKMTCEPGKKNRFSVTAGDGREWKRDIALLPGEYRHITVELPPPAPAPAPVAAPAAASGPDSSEFTAFPVAFYGFDINSRFPQKEWKVEERIFRDIDGDGEPEMLLAVVNKRKKKRGEGPVCLFAVKPGGGYCDVMPMRPPGRQEIGFGELYSLSTTNYDDLGYREVVYVCGDRRGNVTSQGAFIIYRGNLRNPTWMSRKIQ